MCTMFVSCIITLILILLIIILYFKYAFDYWKRKGVPCPKPSIPFGNIGTSLTGKETLGEVVLRMYKSMKSKGYKHAGFYFISSPVYMPLDLETIKNILIKDFQYFMDHGVHYDEVNEPLTAHLFALEGMKWKNLRTRLSPTFSTIKMKFMFQTVLECCNDLTTICAECVRNGSPIDVKDVSSRFTIDVIGSCAFGLDCNSLKNPISEYRMAAKKFFELSTWPAAKAFIGSGWPKLAKSLRLKIIDPEVSKFFLNSIPATMNYRVENNIKRNDFLNSLIQLKNKGHLNDESTDINEEGMITLNEAVAQAFVFFLGGSETSSTGMTFCLFELALHTHIQDKLRKEIQEVMKKHDNNLTFEGIKQMKYLDMVINETLRKYPPVMMLIRKNLKDYHIPDTNIILEKGTMVYIPTFGIQRDPEFYPEPDKFDPERFSDENEANRHPSLFMPFGGGPRICIGMKFGLMQMKIGLCVLLNKYAFTLNSKTEPTAKLNERSFIMIAKGEVLLNVEKV